MARARLQVTPECKRSPGRDRDRAHVRVLPASFSTAPADVRRHLLKDDDFTLALRALRDRINAMQMHYVNQVQLEQQNVRERTWLITALLGLIGLAVITDQLCHRAQRCPPAGPAD